MTLSKKLALPAVIAGLSPGLALAQTAGGSGAPDFSGINAATATATSGLVSMVGANAPAIIGVVVVIMGLTLVLSMMRKAR